MFKKNKLNKDKKIFNFFTLFSIILIFFLALYTINFVKTSNLKIDLSNKKGINNKENKKKNIIKSDINKNIQIKKDNNKINILLLGR
jgi:hypothetical protein